MKVSVLGTTFQFSPEAEGRYAIVDPIADDLIEAIDAAERCVTELGYDAVLLPFSPAFDCGGHGSLSTRLDELVLASDFDGALVVVPTVSHAGIESLIDTLLRLRNEVAHVEMPSFTVMWGFPEKDMLRASSACGFVPLTYPVCGCDAACRESEGLPVPSSKFDVLSLSVQGVAAAVARAGGMDVSEVLEGAVAATVKRAVPFGFSKGA